MMKTAVSVGLVGFLVFCYVIEVSQSFPYGEYIGGLNPAWQDTPECNPLMKESPCDKAVKYYNTSSLDSDVIFTTRTSICACPSGSTCPSGYSNGGPQTLAYKDSAQKISISLHYCQTIYEPNTRTCVGEEVAVVMEGGRVPINYRTINCKCPQNAPMRTKITYMENTWRFVKDLVCEMPMCNMNESSRSPRCKKITRRSLRRGFTSTSTNLCDCPRNYECVGETPNDQTFETFGTCQRIRNK
ncbi:hypothetical protein FSP39_008671 [Pinctada imbricata]|uniref:Uncharacterized protein n=1 Tax=Pinctada imbricata TaxID=66713 RepID=A0AA88XTY9_PINIB|nr:hypothetical protein FSP39_008671 [Pinctada imbricata]